MAEVVSLKKLKSLSVDEKKFELDRLEQLTDELVADRDKCISIFPTLPETIYKVMIRLQYHEVYNDKIDQVNIIESYNQIEVSQKKGNGMYDFSELGLTTLDGFIDILVLIDEVYPVRDLIFWWNQITEISDVLLELPCLESLDLMGNNIRLLPNWIGSMHNLKRLNLSQNRIYEIPDSFGGLKNLEGLYITGNYIMELPESFGNLRELRGLYMKKCPISRLPGSFVRLTKLEVLVCEQFLKEHLPYEIRQKLRMIINSINVPPRQQEYMNISYQPNDAEIVYLIDQFSVPIINYTVKSPTISKRCGNRHSI